MKKGAVGSFKILVNTTNIMHCKNPNDQHQNLVDNYLILSHCLLIQRTWILLVTRVSLLKIS